jgi:hypothetical protein
MLFLVSHANETDSESYTIKHVYLHAASLLHAHVYVTLFGSKISPEYYDPEDEEQENFVGPTRNDVDRYLNHTIEYFEETNKSCSYGEHYWHSIKQIDNLDLQYPLKLDHDEQSKSIFKLAIQTNSACSKHLSDDIFYYYNIEQNTNIYQFQAMNVKQVIQYIFTHVQDYNGLIQFCEQINQTPEQLADTDWETIVALCKTNIEQCNHSPEDCRNGGKINLICEEISQPIPVFHSDI